MEIDRQICSAVQWAVIGSSASHDETELTGILGGSVTFPLRISAAQKFKNGAWSVNTKSLVTVTAGKPPRVLVFDPSYEGRLRFSDESYSLQITDLRMEDTGSYTVEFSTDKEDFSLFCVSPPPHTEGQLPPTIACDSVACEDDACIYTLRCTVRDGRENVTYSWSNAPSTTLRVSRRPFEALPAVICTARHPASNSSRMISPKDLCPGNPPGKRCRARGELGFALRAQGKGLEHQRGRAQGGVQLLTGRAGTQAGGTEGPHHFPLSSFCSGSESSGTELLGRTDCDSPEETPAARPARPCPDPALLPHMEWGRRSPGIPAPAPATL
uniref:Ig-like domain-containing protein n=1 Tax=Terrapene triunguis TaxID=2587831 RepID=A0A674JBX4_9SAUR